MKLSNFLRPDTVALDCSPESGDHLLRCIARIASKTDSTAGTSEEAIYEALLKREKLSSTACGHGVAIPHCRITDISEFTVGLVVLPDGLDFNAANGEKVYLFPFVIGPESEPRVHLKLLSSLAQAFRNSRLRESLKHASSPDNATEILLSSVSHDTTTDKGSGSKLIHVFIQDEGVFDELLQLFAAVDTSSSMVMDADESTRFLMDIPFYAGFWNTDIQHFNRIIVSVVRNELVNAIIRNIEFVCGPLSDRSDVMITVSDLQSVHGSLES